MESGVDRARLKNNNHWQPMSFLFKTQPFRSCMIDVLTISGKGEKT